MSNNTAALWVLFYFVSVFGIPALAYVIQDANARKVARDRADFEARVQERREMAEIHEFEKF